MKTGFKDPDKKPEGKKKQLFDYHKPPYDERSSCYVRAGTNYGVGLRQPVGHKGNPKVEVDTLPRDRRNVDTMKVGYVHKGRTNELEQELG
jgi:hypothetical protein